MAIHLIVEDHVKIIIIILTQLSTKSASYLDMEQLNAKIGSILVLYLKNIMVEEDSDLLMGKMAEVLDPDHFLAMVED